MTVNIPGDTPDWINSIDAAADTLLKVTGGVAVTPYEQQITVGKSYRSLILTTFTPAYTGPVNISFTCTDPAGDEAYRSPDYERGITTGQQPMQWIFPCPVAAGGTITVALTVPAGIVTFNSLFVFASTSDLSGIYGPPRSDGRPYPVGQNAAHDESVTSATLIAAPGAGMRIMLMSLYTTLPSAVINGEIIVQGTVGGTTIDLLVCAIDANANGMMAVAPVPPQGLLLDDNTAVSVINVSTAAQRTNAVYDLVG